MLYKITGWAAIALSLVALFPSHQTGALSVIGFYICLFSLLIGAFASHLGHYFYYRTVFFVALMNVFIINDGTHFMLLIEQSDWVYIGSMYGIFVVVGSICSFLIRREDTAQLNQKRYETSQNKLSP
ncbi:hypothetical protein PCIT_b0835 [Pseudoalteromonas citrea]|uniref:Uncharacterized protein n=2 Tax=Pseudoalteromonas citrea TaxID=43655 RepID=A0AAD4AF34_9GAMM|nr:hypothetical protein [Pseudoalteromonas citrea]KAF7764771.1 hypothetical protein PCIT_b0835 [Pseudoalteromonas citrea]